MGSTTGDYAGNRPKTGRIIPCTEDTSCEVGFHTYSWPCDYAPGTGRFAALEPGDGTGLWPKSLRKFSWRLTAGLWALSIASFILAVTVAPGAINPALGIGGIAIVMTVLSATTLNIDQEDQ